jgi:uncharacterized protein YbcV (DUF1398 family)
MSRLLIFLVKPQLTSAAVGDLHVLNGGTRSRPIACPLFGTLKCREQSLIDRVFTIEQINDLHDRLGTMETFAEYVRALKSVGVERFDSYVVDGHSEFFGTDGHTVMSPETHETISVADTSNREAFLEHLNLHSQHKTSYVEMSQGLAESGIEKWTVDMNRMTMTYYDKTGNALLIESIE